MQPEFILGTTNNAESHEETAATTTTLSLSDGVLRSADGQTVQLIAINANGEQEIISHVSIYTNTVLPIYLPYNPYSEYFRRPC